MASTTVESLRAAIAAMPPGSLVPRDWLLEQFSDPSPPQPATDSTAAPQIDLTIGDLARLFGKRPSTVRAWVERGDFAGAYKLHGKEWRIPIGAVEAFQAKQPRPGKSEARLSAWRSVKSKG
jgi:hypothetical protein